MERSLESDLRRGSEIARYRIEALLGRGGMGVVYLAEDLVLGRKVALKLLAPELAEDTHFRERFLSESRLAASIDHSRIIPIYEAREDDGRLFIAMRYVEGIDLRSIREKEAALAPGRALTLVEQVADALDAAHERGLVHRDVKPGNILVTNEGGREHCYLCDFGLSKHVAADATPAEAGHLSGTADYVAPEQIRGGPLDLSADVYSLGCVLFQCLRCRMGRLARGRPRGLLAREPDEARGGLAPASETCRGRIYPAPTACVYLVCGNPRSTLLVAGSGQRLVTTLPRV